MAEDKSSKTEKPTGRRISKAREEGQVAKSMELNTFGVLMAGLGLLFLASSYMFQQMKTLLTGTLSRAGQISIEGPDLIAFLIDNLYRLAAIVGPVALGIMITGVLINLIQVGPLFTTKPLMPKLEKLNPVKGLGKLFSFRSLVEMFKSIGKLVIVAGIAYLTIKSEMKNIMGLWDLDPAQIGLYVLWVAFKLFLYILWMFLVLAILDFTYQKWKHMEDLKMTKEEIKEEHKQSEGDPKVKAKIRSLQLEAARKRMMSKVPEADVVVTNPTHLAVALLYDSEKNAAPVVVAKGKALLAEKIKQIAEENKVPIMEDKPLARALYKAVEVGETIPLALYQAVAEILAYVYQLKGKQVHGRKSR